MSKEDWRFQLINGMFQGAQMITAIFAYGVVAEYGYGVCLPLFATITAVGTALCAGAYASGAVGLFSLIIFGRFVMGIGIAPIKVSYQSITKKWIKDVKSFAIFRLTFFDVKKLNLTNV